MLGEDVIDVADELMGLMGRMWLMGLMGRGWMVREEWFLFNSEKFVNFGVKINPIATGTS